MRAVLLMAGTATMTMGCLVTEQVEFKTEPNLPPSIVNRGIDNPPTRIATLVMGGAPMPGDAGTGANELLFEVSVRDGNLKQKIQVQVFIDNRGMASRQAELLPSNSLNRDYTFTVTEADLGAAPQGCHKVELRASSGFSFSTPREPVDPEDIGSMVWWFRVVQERSDVTDMGLCR